MYWLVIYVLAGIALAALNASESERASYRDSRPDRIDRAYLTTVAMTFFAGAVFVIAWMLFDMRVPGLPGWVAAVLLSAYLVVAYVIGRIGAWSGIDRYRAELRAQG